MLNKTCFVVTMAMAVGAVGCGGVPSDEGEATTEKVALTTPMALRFWDAGVCLQNNGWFTDVTSVNCSFSAPLSQKWAYQYNSNYGSFTVQSGNSCLVPNGSSTLLPPLTRPCGDQSDDLAKLWQIPDAIQRLPTQVSLFELRNIRNNACLTVHSTGNGQFALAFKACELNRYNTDQTMMTDTFVQ